MEKKASENKDEKISDKGQRNLEKEEDSLEGVIEGSSNNKRDSEGEEKSDEGKFSLGGVSLGIGKKYSKPISKPAKKKPKSLLEKIGDSDETEKVVKEKLEDEDSLEGRYNAQTMDSDPEVTIRYDEKSKDEDGGQVYDAGSTRKKDFYDDTRREDSANDSRKGVYEEERRASNNGDFYKSGKLESEIKESEKKGRERERIGLVPKNFRENSRNDEKVYDGKYN
jgi:hypothetical protein